MTDVVRSQSNTDERRGYEGASPTLILSLPPAGHGGDKPNQMIVNAKVAP